MECHQIINEYFATRLFKIYKNWRDDIEALRIAEEADFTELTDGYTHKFQKIDEYGWREEITTPTFVEMGDSRPCSYNRKHYYNHSIKDWETETIQLNDPSPQSTSSTSSIPPVEYRGITLRQLFAVKANMERRCEQEEWTDSEGNLLTPEKVTLHDINKYVIRPFTIKGKIAFVSAMPSTAGPQPPRYFISHWWGETVNDLIHCIEQIVRDFSRNFNEDDDLKGGGMTADTPIWISAYAINQWNLDEDIADDHHESGFAKAMEIAQGRMITVLDKEGITFSRIWCIFEMLLTFVEHTKRRRKGEKAKHMLWGFYSAHIHRYKRPSGNREEERQAVGVISGGATIDQSKNYRTAAREGPFPFKLIAKATEIKIEEAKATEQHDRICILNSIVGNTGDRVNVPPITHDKYCLANDLVRMPFVSSEERLELASKESDEVWIPFLLALSKGKKRIDMSFNFGKDGWSGLTTDRATQLVAHFPLTIGKLVIRSANFGKGFIEAVIQYTKKSTKLIRLDLYETYAGERYGQDIGVQLAKVLASNNTMEGLRLEDTDLVGSKNQKQWGDALLKNKSLTELKLDGVEKKVINELKRITKDRIPRLAIDLDNGLYSGSDSDEE